MTGVPDADAQTAPKFQPVAQVANLIIENNIIELSLSVPQGYWPEPTAVYAGIDVPALFEVIPYAFRQVLVRGNVIRQVDGQVDGYHAGITIQSTENLCVEENVIDVGSPVKFQKSVAPHFFNNRDSAGRLLRGYDQSSQIFRSEVATTIEDAMLLSL